jgi:hypothetical protein
MNAEEWQELRSMVEDSFWVMRVIGKCDCGRESTNPIDSSEFSNSRVSSVT